MQNKILLLLNTGVSLVLMYLGFISPNELDTYKKQHMPFILKELNELAQGKADIKEDDVVFGEENSDEVSD